MSTFCVKTVNVIITTRISPIIISPDPRRHKFVNLLGFWVRSFRVKSNMIFYLKTTGNIGLLSARNQLYTHASAKRIETKRNKYVNNPKFYSNERNTNIKIKILNIKESATLTRFKKNVTG